MANILEEMTNKELENYKTALEHSKFRQIDACNVEKAKLKGIESKTNKVKAEIKSRI